MDLEVYFSTYTLPDLHAIASYAISDLRNFKHDR